MNERAILGNREFRLIEIIPALEENGRFVLCSDKDGARYICSEEFWMRQAPQLVQEAVVDANSTDQEKIALFLSLFRGREDVYARRYYSLKTGKSGYVPACKNEWEPDLCDKKAYRCPDCPNRAFVPLTAQVVAAYIIGQRKVNTLVLVHSSALLEQWKTSLEQFLDVQEPLPEPPKRRGRKKRVERIGQIGAGKTPEVGS